MHIKQESKQKYYNKFDSSEIVKKAKDVLSLSINSYENEFLCVFNDILMTEPCCYFNKEIYESARAQLELLANKNSNITINDNMLEYFFIAYNTYNQISNIIRDLSDLNDSQEIKNRQYLLPTYISVVEGCISNLFRFITLILDQTTEMNYATQNKLDSLCNILNKNGFNRLTSNIDVQVRNAINHGGIVFRKNGKDIEFHYTRSGSTILKRMNCYDFERLIEEVYDTAGAVILGISAFLYNHRVLICVKENDKTFASWSLYSMKISLPSIRCLFYSEVERVKQLNIDITIDETSFDYIIEVAFLLAIIVNDDFPDYLQYHFMFSATRLQTSWVRFQKKDIVDITSGNYTIQQIYNRIMQRKDIVYFEPSTESIDLHEIKYFRFPNYYGDGFKVNHVEDCSTDDLKRLKCNLFIGNIDDRQKILSIIEDSINWVKQLLLPQLILEFMPHSKYMVLEKMKQHGQG